MAFKQILLEVALTSNLFQTFYVCVPPYRNPLDGLTKFLIKLTNRQSVRVRYTMFCCHLLDFSKIYPCWCDESRHSSSLFDTGSSKADQEHLILDKRKTNLVQFCSEARIQESNSSDDTVLKVSLWIPGSYQHPRCKRISEKLFW